MTKQELIQRIALNADVSRADVGRVLDELAAVSIADLRLGGVATLPHLGRLTLKDTAERQGRNPKTGQAITIPAGKRVVFKASKQLVDYVT